MLVKNSLHQRLAISGTMLAISIVLGYFTSQFKIGDTVVLKIGLAQLPIFFLSIVVGPKYGATAGFVGDFIRALLSSAGAYNPFFGLTAALAAALPGLFFHRKAARPALVKLYLVLLANQLLCSLLLNTLLIHWFYGTPLLLLLSTRVLAAVADPIILSLGCYGLLRLAEKNRFISFSAPSNH